MKLVSTLLLLIFFISIRISYASTLVSAEEATSLLMYPTRSSPARVIPLNQSLIPAQTSGVVTKLMVNVGDKVVKGEILATLDCDINLLTHKAQSAKYEQLYSLLLFNKRELVRGRSLLKQKNIGEAELDRLNNAVENSRALIQTQKATVDSALLNVERCNIKAPYDGVVTMRIANLGEMIDFGKPVVELIEDNRLEVSAKIATSDEPSFYQAKVYSLDIDDHSYNVTLRSSLPVIEHNTRSREARFLFIDKQAIAGSTGRLRWKSPIPYLPAHLLQRREGRNGYFVINNNKAKFVVVETAEEGRPIPYYLPDSTQIITDGRHGLNDGDNIEKAVDNKTFKNGLGGEQS
ncbi:efflux RND transporter periplasmic adaptor subunit [Colwellia sp. UCD-KL20]|uniref:efflux RND transporter periplasmic adaptor subunit n=1 Tax=Colwellia sp. UCD-KL20 TaxID=1917165 RepID=UPI000970C2CB|nr:efflux RND transporter periplasmic adaptor subunit [Colwellia sp. UCD-KL20]